MTGVATILVPGVVDKNSVIVVSTAKPGPDTFPALWFLVITLLACLTWHAVGPPGEAYFDLLPPAMNAPRLHYRFGRHGVSALRKKERTVTGSKRAAEKESFVRVAALRRRAICIAVPSRHVSAPVFSHMLTTSGPVGGGGTGETTQVRTADERSIRMG